MAVIVFPFSYSHILKPKYRYNGLNSPLIIFNFFSYSIINLKIWWLYDKHMKAWHEYVQMLYKYSSYFSACLSTVTCLVFLQCESGFDSKCSRCLITLISFRQPLCILSFTIHKACNKRSRQKSEICIWLKPLIVLAYGDHTWRHGQIERFWFLS